MNANASLYKQLTSYNAMAEYLADGDYEAEQRAQGTEYEQTVGGRSLTLRDNVTLEQIHDAVGLVYPSA